MLKTLKIKLFPTPDQKQTLLNTMKVFNQACDEIALFAHQKSIFSKFEIQKQLYHGLREKYGLSAQLTIRAIAKTIEALKASRKKKKTSLPAFKPTGAIVYDQRCFGFKGLEAISLLTLERRIVVPIILGGYNSRELAAYGKRGQADLIYSQGTFYLCVVVEVPEPEPIESTDVLGVDLGIVNLATDSDNKRFSGAHTKNLSKRYFKIRKRLQAKGTKSAKCLLKKRNRKEMRMKRDKNHVISKTLVAKAKDTGCKIALEDLKGIRKRTTVRKAQRRDHHGWSFHQLRHFIEYKAAIAGIEVVYIDPRNTSRECVQCHHIDKRRPTQSKFKCVQCGFVGHADHVAALNIQSRAAVNRPNVEAA